MCADHYEVDASTDERRALPTAGIGRRRFLTGVAATAVGVAGAGVLPALSAQAASTSSNGWPLITSSSDSHLDRGFHAGGVVFFGGVRKGDVSTILRYVANRFDREVENLHNPGCWGWSYRRISDSSSYSNHASGTAIDCNAPRHPLGASGTLSAAQVRKIHAIVAVCEGTVRWGGDYRNRKDEMHFEINKLPSDPAIARVAHKLGGGVPPTDPPASTGWPSLKSGDQGFRVKSMQYLLIHAGHPIKADAVFGPKTKAAVNSFKIHRGLTADGIFGPKAWAKGIVTVKTGSHGSAVKGAQTALNAHGAKLKVDGIAGSGTHRAIVAFQRKQKLSADGIVGAKTWNKLV